MGLNDLGDRICVMGPSNSGKSTLAAAIGRQRCLPVVHLDRLRHVAGTQWELQSDEEFTRLHEAAVAEDRWVIEGNYSALLPPRLARATGFILLDVSMPRSLSRYIGRTAGLGSPRVGGLEATADRLSWGMVRYIAGPTRADRKRYRALFEQVAVPKVLLADPSEIRRFYRQEGLSRT